MKDRSALASSINKHFAKLHAWSAQRNMRDYDPNVAHKVTAGVVSSPFRFVTALAKKAIDGVVKAASHVVTFPVYVAASAAAAVANSEIDKKIVSSVLNGVTGAANMADKAIDHAMEYVREYRENTMNEQQRAEFVSTFAKLANAHFNGDPNAKEAMDKLLNPPLPDDHPAQGHFEFEQALESKKIQATFKNKLSNAIRDEDIQKFEDLICEYELEHGHESTKKLIQNYVLKAHCTETINSITKFKDEFVTANLVAEISHNDQLARAHEIYQSMNSGALFCTKTGMRYEDNLFDTMSAFGISKVVQQKFSQQIEHQLKVLQQARASEATIGTKDYDGQAYFWSNAYKHELRAASPEERKQIHDELLKANLVLNGISEQHEHVIRDVLDQEPTRQEKFEVYQPGTLRSMMAEKLEKAGLVEQEAANNVVEAKQEVKTPTQTVSQKQSEMSLG
jgi:hypothetical protein